MLKRIKEYIDFKCITVSAFERSIGMSNASFGKSLKNNGSIGGDKLEIILKVYPDINAEWLITGKGTMLNPSERVADAGKASDHFVVSDKMVSENEHLKAELSSKNSQIADLRDHISTLKTQLSECQKRENILLNSVFSDKKTVK